MEMDASNRRQGGDPAASGVGRVRRRRLLIDGKFQLALAGNMLLIVGAGMLATALVVSWTFVYFLGSRLTCAIDMEYLMKLGIILGFVLAGIAVWTVRRVHAISGPIFRTRQLLQAAARWDFPRHPVAFRRGDAFGELDVDLNRCLEIMRMDRERLMRLQATLDSIQHPSEPS